MAWWTRGGNRRQRGTVKAHEAKAMGKHRRREDDQRALTEGVEDICNCPRFADTGGFRIADLTCPIHGIDGTEPGDGWW